MQAAVVTQNGVEVREVPAPVAERNQVLVRVLGRIVNVGRLGGAKGEFDYDLHALKRIAYIGVTFRTRSIEEVREINRRMRADLWGAIGAGKLRLPLDRSFPLAEAAAALAYMRANAHFGKIVLTRLTELGTGQASALARGLGKELGHHRLYVLTAAFGAFVFGLVFAQVLDPLEFMAAVLAAVFVSRHVGPPDPVSARILRTAGGALRPCAR